MSAKDDKEGYVDYDDCLPYYNRPPLSLEGETNTRSLADGSTGVVNVGTPVVACDPDGDTLRYNYLDGADAEDFSLNAGTGQLTTKSGATYDKTTHGFSVIVEEQGTDEGYLSAIGVTVTIK